MEAATFEVVASADVLLSALDKLPYERDKVLPVLSYVLVQNKNGMLYFSSTDLETYGTVIVDDSDSPSSEGKVCVNLEKLKALFKSLGSSKVKLKQEEDSLRVEVGRARYKVPGIDPEEFSEFPDIEGQLVCEFTLEAEALKEGLSKTGFAVAKSEFSQMSLAGLCLRSLGDRLHMVASDGHRLALFEISAEVPEFTSILPARAVKALVKLSGEVKVRKFEKYIVFESAGTTYTIREIDAEYPDYLSVIPSEDRIVCRIELYKNDLKEALERMMGFSRELGGGVAFYTKSDRLLVRLLSHDDGEGEEEIGVTHVEGGEVATAFNPRYILDYLKRVESERVWMKFTGQDTACVMGEDFTYLVMPMRL